MPLSIACLAAAALAYELLLFRLLAIVQWQPFAAMIVSLALLGHGAGGSALALAGARMLARFPLWYAAGVASFSATSVLAFALAQRVPFNGLELAWDPGQLPRLSLVFAVLALPFFCAACCFGLAFMALRQRIAALYASDLLGAGLGAAGIVGLLFVLTPADALRVIALAPLIPAAAVVAGPDRRRAWALCAAAALCVAFVPARWLAPHITEFKGLPRALAAHGARVVEERSSPYGLLTVVRNDVAPLRHAPGQSLIAGAEPPAQLAVFTDGDALGAITPRTGSLEFLDRLTSALPYHLLHSPRTLVLGAGAGMDVLQALELGAGAVDAVELNPQLVQLVRDTYGDFAGGLYSDPRVRLHLGDARGFVRAASATFDLIVVPPLDAYSGAGVHAAAESHAYTVEALRDAYRRLAPGGLLSLTRWERQPPRDSLKLFATAVSALRAEGAAPEAQLAAIRGWQTSTLLVKRGAFAAAELAALREFCQARGFDPAYFPGIQPPEVNRYTRVARPWLYEGALALLGPQAGAFVDAYKFDLRPATDDRPYFFHFFRWRLLPELLSLRGQGGLTLLDTGYLLLVGTLAQALPLALVLILVPLLVLPRAERRAAPLAYFTCLGLAFLFIEIACLQRYSLYIGHPLMAAATLLGGFLAFAGLGAALAARLHWSAARLAVAGIVLLVVVQMLALPPPQAAQPLVLKAAVSLAAIAPLAFLMGLPFPLGLARLAAEAPASIPWAWGINGCASVLAALLAAVLAVHFGFALVLGAAAVLYVIAVASWR